MMSYHYLKDKEYFWPLIHCLGLLCALQTSRYLPDFKDRASFVKAAYLASPDNVASTVNYALYLMDENDLKKSEAIVLEALKKWPHSVLVHNNIAVLYLRTQRYAEARTHLERAIALDPSYWLCYKNIVVVLAFQNQWQAMDPYLLKLKSLKPGTFQDLLAISSQMQREGMEGMARNLAQKVNTMLLNPGIAH